MTLLMIRLIFLLVFDGLSFLFLVVVLDFAHDLHVLYDSAGFFSHVGGSLLDRL